MKVHSYRASMEATRWTRPPPSRLNEIQIPSQKLEVWAPKSRYGSNDGCWKVSRKVVCNLSHELPTFGVLFLVYILRIFDKTLVLLWTRLFKVVARKRGCAHAQWIRECPDERSRVRLVGKQTYVKKS